jgi:hypothetical protein
MLQYLSALIVLALGYLCPDINLSSESLDTSQMSTKAFIVYSCYACIIAPITEEFLYRGFVLKTCSRVSQRFGIFISALFFGLAHGNITQFVLAFLVGIFMAHIDTIHNSLLPSICVHFSINTLSTVTSLFTTDTDTVTPVLILLGIAEVCIAAAGLVMFILFRRKKKLPFTMPHQKMRGGSVAVTSWGIILCFVLFLIQFAVNMFLG